ncbi:MAG: metallophosphoesterase [Myxococcota bacterium]|nr:metallophosphoesterase [Myxococcota bacterium]
MKSHTIILLLALGLALGACGEAPPDPEPVDYPPLQFVAMGDTGEGNDDQYAVAAIVEQVCADQGCDFVLLLGDNIYNTGVDALDDLQWQDKFELPYANIDLPFYAVLGNHDYGNAVDEDRAAFQVAYSEVSEKWNMPGRHYLHSHSNVDLLGLDTHAMYYNTALEEAYTAQVDWLDEVLAEEAGDRWRIAYGHHPYLSNGVHGNAGWYDGMNPDIPQFSGIGIKELFDERLCGDLDLYLSGHDHDRQWLVETCDGTQLVVSGAGAKLRSFENDQPVHWADDTTEGFVWIEIDDQDLRLQFWDKAGAMNYEGSFSRSAD